MWYRDTLLYVISYINSEKYISLSYCTRTLTDVFLNWFFHWSLLIFEFNVDYWFWQGCTSFFLNLVSASVTISDR